MRAQLIILLSVVLLALISPVMATTGTVTIWGTNASNAQQNVTISNAPANITVTAWNVGGIKTFTVHIKNTSDTITFNLYNFTATQVNELKVNSTSINGYQSDSNGLITFTRTQGGIANHTFNIQPAINQGGYNYTWAYFLSYPFIGGTNISTIITNLIEGYGYVANSNSLGVNAYACVYANGTYYQSTTACL